MDIVEWSVDVLSLIVVSIDQCMSSDEEDEEESHAICTRKVCIRLSGSAVND